jgi:serine/threonine-protein kinase RsbW
VNANTDFSALDFIEAPATMDSWELLMDFVSAQSIRHLNDSPKSYGMRLAAEEILSNMMRETKSPSQNQAAIIISITSAVAHAECCSWFEITIKDNGPPFDPKLEKPREIPKDLPISERPIGGIGLFLVQQSVDDARYQWRNNQNIYRLRMQLSSI